MRSDCLPFERQVTHAFILNGSDENVNAGSQDGNPKVRGLILMEPALYALYPRACHFTGSALRVISVNPP